MNEEVTKNKVHNLICEVDSFKGWLSHNKDSAVGVAQKENSCPINEWLFAQTRCNVAIRPTEYGLCGKDYELPSWAKRFVEALDGEYEECDEIYGSTALEVLSWAVPD